MSPGFNYGSLAAAINHTSKTGLTATSRVSPVSLGPQTRKSQ
ncbi:hypothetical protein JOF47_000565 [Paeniglutamicibacter kerguelensis]|uniref:Uncharacterized protein n=1 Tax=Paeniglutamicibacter kerguelensis TaxID=254788 RepID=A0ABS4X9B3_9MICC|nr:hypothetical protein [Paeniglutamicibacter kerguelensis]